MNKIKDYDRELIFKLQKIARDVHSLQIGLYSGGHGCPCEAASLCAWHSETLNRLSEIEKMINLEVNHLYKGESLTSQV